jgi:hypothetical protein
MTSIFDKQFFGQGGALFARSSSESSSSGSSESSSSSGSPSADVTYEGQFCAIQVVVAAKFKTFTWTKLGGYPNFSTPSEGDPIHNTLSVDAVEFPAGTVIYGQVSSFTLHSGAVLAYNSIRI